MTWHEFLLLIINEVIDLVATILVVKLFKHVNRLCNFNNSQMADRYVKHNCCLNKIWKVHVMSF